jgi:hypothetical protein
MSNIKEVKYKYNHANHCLHLWLKMWKKSINIKRNSAARYHEVTGSVAVGRSMGTLQSRGILAGRRAVSTGRASLAAKPKRRREY